MDGSGSFKLWLGLSLLFIRTVHRHNFFAKRVCNCAFVVHWNFLSIVICWTVLEASLQNQIFLKHAATNICSREYSPFCLNHSTESISQLTSRSSMRVSLGTSVAFHLFISKPKCNNVACLSLHLNLIHNYESICNW